MLLSIYSRNEHFFDLHHHRSECCLGNFDDMHLDTHMCMCAQQKIPCKW
jgi:hypothetical protein